MQCQTENGGKTSNRLEPGITTPCWGSHNSRDTPSPFGELNTPEQNPKKHHDAGARHDDPPDVLVDFPPVHVASSLLYERSVKNEMLSFRQC
jgi:hypothetical protein